MSFTPAQLDFITASGNCIALAGPGSGKTTSLIEKIIRLLGKPGSKIIAATFTRDAADEMTKRLTKRIGKEALESGRVVINTWHSLALDHRRKHKLHKKVISPAHQAMLIRRVISAHESPDLVNAALQEFESIKCSLDADFSKVTFPWFQQYQRELERHDSIDLYDAVRETAIMISSKKLPPFDATDLIVDETQDNDEVQFELADVHAALGITTSMVGDDDQCIYEWRRARGYEGMKAFAEKRNAKIVVMGDNFRSLKNVVDTADKLIRYNTGFRLPKTFIARRGAGGSVSVKTMGDIDTTSASIVEGISTWAQEVPNDGLVNFIVPTNSVAILARNNHLLDAAEAELLRAQIKYVRSGKSIWESEPADLLMTLLATMVSYDSRGLDVALQISGLQHNIISAVSDRYASDIKGFISGQATISDFGVHTENVAKVSQMMAVFHSKAEKREYGSLIGSMAAFVKNIYRQNSKKNVRYRNILTAVASALIALRGPLVLRLKTARTTDHKNDADNAVVLQTFHGSKGLEFNNVFLLGVDQEVIPGDSEIRAERRLLYVACTRAKENLVLTYTAGKQSQYIAELA